MTKQNALQDYVEVNVRIEKFWEKYPEGRLDTEIVSWKDGVVVMKASAYRHITDPVPSATGTAYEKEGSSFINKTSALENCETSAVGRALAILGFEIKKSVASREEVENAKLNQGTQQSNAQASDKQLNLIKKLIKEISQQKNCSEGEAIISLKKRMKSGKDFINYTSQEASKAIGILNEVKGGKAS